MRALVLCTMLAFAACSPTPSPEGPTPSPTQTPTAEPATTGAPSADPTATPTSTPTSSPTSNPSSRPPPKPYTGALTPKQVRDGIDALCKGVETDLEAAKSKKYADGIAVLLEVGPIGIRVHSDFWFAALAQQLGVPVPEIEAFFDDPKALGDVDAMKARFDKVPATFAHYKEKRAELEKGLPKATQATCDKAFARRQELAAQMPKNGALLSAEVLAVLVPFSVNDQAVKRCTKHGIKM